MSDGKKASPEEVNEAIEIAFEMTKDLMERLQEKRPKNPDLVHVTIAAMLVDVGYSAMRDIVGAEEADQWMGYFLQHLHDRLASHGALIDFQMVRKATDP
jgi:hypothetical protein